MSVVQFISPLTCIVSGSTSSGKTYWLDKLFQNKEIIFDKPPEQIILL